MSRFPLVNETLGRRIWEIADALDVWCNWPTLCVGTREAPSPIS
jgi:hypothetical protein